MALAIIWENLVVVNHVKKTLEIWKQKSSERILETLIGVRRLGLTNVMSLRAHSSCFCKESTSKEGIDDAKHAKIILKIEIRWATKSKDDFDYPKDYE